MNKYTLHVLLILVAILGLNACQRAKPSPVSVPDTVIPSQAPEEICDVEFSLNHAIGENTHLRPQAPFTVTIENCTGDEALTREHREMYTLPTDYFLDMEVMLPDLAAQRAAMEAFVEQRYGIEDTRQWQVERTVTLKVPPHTRAAFTLRWQEIWDRNTLDVSVDGQVIASIPLSGPLSAELESISSQQQPCAPEDEGVSEIVSVPKTATSEPTPGIVTWTPGPGSEKSIALVRDYLYLLGEGEYERAYDLLHPVYRDAVSYERYVEAYRPLEDIELQAIESTTVGQYIEAVRVGMIMTTKENGEMIHSPWEGIFEVIIARGNPPYQRRISDVRMKKLDIE